MELNELLIPYEDFILFSSTDFALFLPGMRDSVTN